MNAERLLAHYARIADAPDAIARLRRFILDLAVRGKLGPQNQNDEPASELLKRIAAERVRLVKAGEIRKEKLLPEIEPDQIPFDAPRGWEWVRIRKVTSDRGQMVPDQDFTYIDVTAINKEVGCIEDAKVTSESEAPSRARKIVRQGDVLYSCVRPYLLNIAVVETEISPSPIASTAFAVLNGFGLVLPRYQWIVLRSPYLVTCVEEKMRGQAYPAINDSDFALLPFPLPPLVEQHRIVAKVDELMALCDRLEAARAQREATRDRLAAASLARLSDPDPETFKDDARFALDALPALTTRPDQIKQLRQAILNLAVRGKLVPQEPTDEPASKLLKRIEKEKVRLVKAGEIRRTRDFEPLADVEKLADLPVGWAATRMGIAYDVRDGTHDTPKYVDDGFPLITSKNLSSGYLSFADVKLISERDHQQISERSRVDKGDVLLAMIGSIGNPVVVDTDRPFSIKNVALLKYYDRNLSNSGFLRYFLQYAANEMRALAAGGLQPFVSLGFLRAYPVPLPPLAEQHRIVAKVDELMALCDRLEADLAAAAAIRRRLLDALLAEALAPGEVLVPQKSERVAAHG